MKIGVFGGTFNPPHNGHIQLLKRIEKRLKLDRVIVIPSNLPPHKEVAENYPVHRINMARLAFPDYEVSDMEITRGGKSYTYMTLEELHEMNPGDKLYFICGSDMFLTFDEWKNPERIFKVATVVTSARDKREYLSLLKKKLFLKKKYKAKTDIVFMKPYVLSSTDIRLAVNDGESITDDVPEGVMAYIKENGLYK